MGNPQVTPITENRHDAGFVVSEATGHRSRDMGTLLAGAALQAGSVLGKITTSGTSATAVALGTNTGNGTFGTIAPVTVPTLLDTYKVVFTAATAYTVTAPGGATANGTTGVAFSALGLGFTITAGGTAFVANDSFSITPAAGPNNPTAAAVAGTNTGNGTFGTIATSVAPTLGIYTVEFDSATNYVVTAPNGAEIGHGTTGTAFNAGGLGFTITAGGTAFVAADSFAITVTNGSNKYTLLDPTGADGRQNAAAILRGFKDATLADKKIAIMSRSCEVNTSELIWGANVTAVQQAVALAQLTALGIICR